MINNSPVGAVINEEDWKGPIARLIGSNYNYTATGRAAASTEAGNWYVTVSIGGIKKEGEDHPMKAITRELAEEEFVRSFLRVLPPVHGHQLVWRRYPRVEQLEDGYWVVSARAVVELEGIY